LIVGRAEIKLRIQGGGEKGQTLIVVLFAMPLLIAIIALVADGSSAFANKRRVQNAADATALAVAQDLPRNRTACLGPDTTSGTCLYKLRTDAQDYSDRNGGTATIHACNDSAGQDWNCYVTPYKGENSSVQIRIARTISTFFAGSFGLFTTSARATAAVGLGGPASAAGNVSPVGIDKSAWSPDLIGVSGTTLTFSGPAGFPLFDESHVCASGSTLSYCSPSGPITAGTQCNRSTSDMNNDVRYGYPGDGSTVVLPANAWYCDNNGCKGGIKGGLQDVFNSNTVLLIPVFNSKFTPTSGTPTSYHVVGFAAFVIEQDPKNTWDSSCTSQNATQQLIGHFTTFIATGVSGGSGTDDFGVRVITLSE
jgi:hypothetical protein